MFEAKEQGAGVFEILIRTPSAFSSPSRTSESERKGKFTADVLMRS